MKRQAEIKLPLAGETRLKRFHATERLSMISEIQCEVVLDSRADIKPSLGKSALITVYEMEKPVRYFHSRLVEAHYMMNSDEHYHYSLTLKPWIYTMQGATAYRIFEGKRAPEIIKYVLSQYSGRVEYRLSQVYYPWPYCTQYNESDFDFMMRIMEKEGMYFFFDHKPGEEVLIVADGASAHRPSPRSDAATVKLRPDYVGRGGFAEAMWAWQEHVTGSGIKSVEVKSYDYEKSNTPKGAQKERQTLLDKEEEFEFLGDFIQPSLARHWAEMRNQSNHARDLTYTGSGDMIGICCGGRFKLDGKAFSHGSEFIVTALDYQMDAEPYQSGAQLRAREIAIEAVPRDVKWRAPFVTPPPVGGPELAVVKEGGADDSTADASGVTRGRVRVEFMWAQLDPKRTKWRSCWCRVSHPSAGAGFGHVTLPRTGEEVIVDFLNGNPDRPVVTGRVYNSDHRHAYALPTHRTRSLYRSQTIGRSGSYAGAERRPPAGTGYNEFMFEDKGGAEEVYLRAQRNRRSEVFLDDDEKVRRDQRNRVGRDRKTAIKRNDSTTLETGNHSLKIMRGSSMTSAFRRILIRVGASRILMTPQMIIIAQGQSRIMLDPTGIKLTIGPTILNLTPATLTETAPTIALAAEAEISLDAPTVNITTGALTSTSPVIPVPPV